MKPYRRIYLVVVVASLILIAGPWLSRFSMGEHILATMGSIYNPSYPYDEQLGITFTQDFTSLSYNVTAVQQTGPDGLGPAYYLNGLSNLGYWYQVGLAWNWLNLEGSGYSAGFRMNYEVFDASGNSIYPNVGTGEDFLVVNAGDTVLLSLSISASNVMMVAKDWNTSSSASEGYGAQGATRFVGSPNGDLSQSGFFTGLMTEEFHSSPYYGGEQPVTYAGYTSSAATMWIDEFNGVSKQTVFCNSTYSPITLRGSQPHFLSANGVAEASTGSSFVTGLHPIPSPKVSPFVDGPLYPGSSTNLSIGVTDVGVSLERISNVTISSDFGTFVPRSGLPFNLTLDHSGRVDVPLDVPSWARVGNHTVSISVTWIFYNSELFSWVEGAVGLRGLVSVTTVFYVPIVTALKNPVIQAAIAASSLAILAMLILITWKRRKLEPPQQTNAILVSSFLHDRVQSLVGIAPG